MYHRFVLKSYKPDPENEGILSFATTFQYNKKIDPELKQGVRKVIGWFNGHLQCPHKFKIKRRKNEATGLFWFQDQPVFIEKAKELAAALGKLGIKTSHIVSDDPGEIIIEDQSQVVAKFNRRVKWSINP